MFRVGTLAVVLSVGMSMSAFAQGTANVWTHHIQAWQDQDIDAIAADYDDYSLLILNNHVYRGAAAITQVFRQLFTIFADGNNRIEPAQILDSVIYLTWHFTPHGHREYFGTDTFIVEKGKIKLQTIGSDLYEIKPIRDR